MDVVKLLDGVIYKISLRKKLLKERPEAKKFQFKGVSPLVEEMWDHLFGDAVATGESCVAPSSTPEFVDQSLSQVEEIQDKEGGTEDAYIDCSQHSNRLESLDVQEDGFWQNFIEDVRAANIDFEVGGDTWCHVMLMFQDPTRREIFFKMPSDDARNDVADMVFNVVQQHGDYIPMEDLDGETSSNEGIVRGSSNEMLDTLKFFFVELDAQISRIRNGWLQE
ncbi:hypothetical protein L6452_17290 [Arctium lappa]|uniref:Uncharacterized protein n=1 Tax=Arctium lappa TaxID=4217 RepID=A0ACB9C301_ARCLA|nr:hypothetical protein L6452_17290 [Arctium lappa]